MHGRTKRRGRVCPVLRGIRLSQIPASLHPSHPVALRAAAQVELISFESHGKPEDARQGGRCASILRFSSSTPNMLSLSSAPPQKNVGGIPRVLPRETPKTPQQIWRFLLKKMGTPTRWPIQGLPEKSFWGFQTGNLGYFPVVGGTCHISGRWA